MAAFSTSTISSSRSISSGMAQTSGRHSTSGRPCGAAHKRVIRCSSQGGPDVTNAFGRKQQSAKHQSRSCKTDALTLGTFSETSQHRSFLLEELLSEITCVPARAWAAYNRALQEKPLPTKAIVMALGLALGDVFAQSVTTGAVSNLARTAQMAFFGLAFQGPALHFLNTFLEARVQPQAPTSKTAVITKVSIDQGIFAPAAIAVFISFMQLSSGCSSLTAVGQALQSTLLPTLQANYLVWPAALLINYAVIPPQHRILFVNLITVVWSAILSVIV